ncbi:hypothetical protein ACFY4C_37200 [Actinomadura viridis]|uniref:hypothetical protein n=1 Tax=Actinomadura viridis TaxID=58110 RepID=UPI0036959D14
MSVSRINVSSDILQKLGEDGVREVCSCLWAVDCQTCGRFLGDKPPSLAVDETMVFATASLHHQACRAPGWNDSGRIIQIPEENLSWLSVMVSFPVITPAGEQEFWPMLLVNPGLEQVPLVPDGAGGWKVLRTALRDLQPSGMGLEVTAPLSNAVATLTADSLAVSFDLGGRSYSAPASEDYFQESVRALGGVLIGFSHALHPDHLNTQIMNQAILSGWIGVGRVMLHGASLPTPPPAPQDTPTANLYTLEWNAEYMSVGQVLAHTADDLTVPAALEWANDVLGAGDALIGWTPVDEDRPDEGWFTLNALSVQMYFLRRHPDGWRLVAALARVSGKTRVQTDNEAKAWAVNHLKRKGQPTKLSWTRGPSTPAATTLYAQA